MYVDFYITTHINLSALLVHPPLRRNHLLAATAASVGVLETERFVSLLMGCGASKSNGRVCIPLLN
jgi:hypothetical protein